MFRYSPGRLSTRWKVLQHNATILNTTNRIGYVIAIGLSILLMTACQDKSTAQSATDGSKQSKVTAQARGDSLKKPKVDIKVNRHFDEKGNMIGFDSTYTSYYSSVDGDSAKMNSMFKDFNTYFKDQHESIFDDHFNNLFFNDSLMYPDFFHKDFFSQRYKLNDKYFREMMSEMDSVKNKFYRDNRTKRKP